MMEPRNRGVLDTPHARGTTTVNGGKAVIKAKVVGTLRFAHPTRLQK
jgi:hypothetical protein